MPETLTLDHGTVFYDNTTPPPFPTRLHFWLLALGIQVRFTRKRCPTDHAIIERTQQTMTEQALVGQTYPSRCALWAGLDERQEVLNHHLPSRALSHKPPLEAYPQAIHWDNLTVLNGKKSYCLWSRCAAISPRAGVSAASALMGSLAWEAINTTLASTLPSAAWLFALILRAWL